MKLTKKQIQEIENLGWSVDMTDYGYCLQNYSPAGGEMTIEVKSKEDIITHCENFDAEEEFKVWYGANRGEPSSVRDLLEDCEEQEKMYEELKEILTK